jgi:hypothetical protein
MEVVLDGNSIVVTIPQERLNESTISGQRGSVMLTMSLLSSFGAGHEGETGGYIVVPDGSGAVIEFDNNKTNSAQYFGQVYGRDWAVSRKFAPPVSQQVYLPVFGIVRGGEAAGNALVAVAEKGDENAVVRAAVSRQGSTLHGLANNTAFNVAWFDFTMRTEDTFRIGASELDLNIYESEFIKTGDISVRYFPIAKEGVSYADVALTYRDYLINHVGIKPVQNADNSPFYMTLNGGTIKRQSVLGIPVSQQTAATTYAQAQTMIETLSSRGVNNLVIAYNDFNTASIKREVSVRVQYSGMLGGRRGFNNLNSAANSLGVQLFPSLGFMEFVNSGNWYSPALHSSRQVTRSRASQPRYELAFGTPDRLQTSSTVLSPFYFPGAFDSIISSLKSEGITNVSLDQATWLLYSDFSRRNPFGTIYFNRRDTREVLTNGFKALNDAGIRIMAQGANAYAFPYVSHITDVPMFSSNFDLFDYDIPFYQIVISGLIPYSTTPFNETSNPNALTLLALSTGTPVHYEFMYSDAGDFNDSEYNKKFYSSYHGWIDDAVEMYKFFNEHMGGSFNRAITGHKRLGVNDYETTFEDGKTVRINLNTNELLINGQRVDFLSKGGVR